MKLKDKLQELQIREDSITIAINEKEYHGNIFFVGDEFFEIFTTAEKNYVIIPFMANFCIIIG